MKKGKKKKNKELYASDFLMGDDFSIMDGDEDAEKLLDSAFGGARQWDQSLEEALEGMPELESRKAPKPDVSAALPVEPMVQPEKDPVVSEETLYQHVVDNFPIRKYGNLPYIRRGYVWQPVTDDTIGAILMQSLPHNLRKGFRSAHAAAVARRIIFAQAYEEDSLVLPKNAMLFRNCCVNVLTGEEIVPHDNWFFPFAIHADYNPDSYYGRQCPVFDRFVSQISNHDPETEALFLSFLAYCLMPGAPLKKLFVLGPEHDTGKSQVALWLEHYVGEEQTTVIPLEKYHQHFMLADIVGKSLAFSMELPADPIPSKATIVAKGVTGHDKIQVQQKYMRAFKYRPHAKLICGTNHSIRSDDFPFWRRVLVLPCLNSIPPELQDDALLEKLYAEEEAIMLRLVDAARELVQNGMEFPYCEASLRVKEDWQRNNIPNLARFISEMCELSPDARCWSEDLYDAFAAYCSARDASVPSMRAFVDALKIGWPELHQARWAENKRQGRGFYGISLR